MCRTNQDIALVPFLWGYSFTVSRGSRSRTRLTWLTGIPAAEPDSLGSRGSLQQSQTHLVHVDPYSRARLTWFTWIPAAETDSLGSRGSLQQNQTHLTHMDPRSKARLTWLTWIPAAKPDSLGSRGSPQQNQTHLAHVDPCSRTRSTWLMWISACNNSFSWSPAYSCVWIASPPSEQSLGGPLLRLVIFVIISNKSAHILVINPPVELYI
jgi:hypothetical protein